MPLRFNPIPWTPTCVTSRNARARWQRIRPLDAGSDPEATFRLLRTVLAGMKGATVEDATDEVLHAVFRTPLGFRDDVECAVAREECVIHVRSTSRIAPIWDFGANRRRVEAIRRRLRNQRRSG